MVRCDCVWILEIQGQHYPMKTVEEVAAELSGAKIFSVLDEKRSELLTINTSFGRYQYLGCNLVSTQAPEIFQKITNQGMLPNNKSKTVINKIKPQLVRYHLCPGLFRIVQDCSASTSYMTGLLTIIILLHI